MASGQGIRTICAVQGAGGYVHLLQAEYEAATAPVMV